jgi:small subunit ribosomal protein S3
MGQKVHPLIQRIGFIKDWNNRWFSSKKDFAKNLMEDIKIKDFIKRRFVQAAIARVVIERFTERMTIRIYTARPGMVIGRHGADIERLRQDLADITMKELNIEIEEVTEPFLEAQLVAENIAFQLEKRIAFRRAMKRAIEQSMNAGAEGIRISCAGRLGGAEMSRREGYKQGKIPLQTLRADIDYGFAEAHTTYGIIGVKVWIYKGKIMPKKKKESEQGLVPESIQEGKG